MAATNKTLIQEFYTSFQAAQSDLSARLDALKAEGSPPQDAVNGLALDVAKVRKDFSDTIRFLPSYDQRQYEQSLKSLEQSLDDLRSASADKPKFLFKRKAQKPATSTNTPAATNTAPQVAQPPFPSKPSHSLTLTDHSHRYLTWLSVPSVAVPATDLAVSDLDHCVVDLLSNYPTGSVPTITAVHMRNVKNSILTLPFVQGSAMIHDMDNCLLLLGCHQFRMHTSTQVDVCLSIDSNPVIEHCSKLRFAPYPASLVERAGGATSTIGQKLSVQDFSHIRATPSPNWSLLANESRLNSEDVDNLTTPSRDSVDNTLRRFLAQPPPY